MCFSFRGHREYNGNEKEPDYNETDIFWKDYMVKFAFTIAFNVRPPPLTTITLKYIKYTLYLLVSIFVYVIPDRAWQLEEKIKIEKYLITEVLNLNIDEQKVEEVKEEIRAEEEAREEEPSIKSPG